MSNPTFCHFRYRGVFVTEKIIGNTSEFTWCHEISPDKRVCSVGVLRTFNSLKRAIAKHLKYLAQ